MNLSEPGRNTGLQGQQEWNIWVIDDDLITRTLIRTVLEGELHSAKLNIREFSSFRSAAEAFSTPEHVDLVFLDNYLGDGEGIDVLPHILSFGSQAQGSRIPVMMVSSNDDQSFLARCFKAGAADYVTKPFDVSLLGYKAHAMLKAKRNQDIVVEQNEQLERLISAREREEEMARFTYDFYLRRTHIQEKGVWTYIKTPNAFSGDLMLSARSPDGRVVFMLADAMGHDLSAAITLIPVISRFQRMVEKGYRLPHLVLEINDRLLEDTPGDRFIAAVFLELDPQASKLHIWNGGMPPVLEVTHTGRVYAEHHAEHMALGILEDTEFSTATQVIELRTDHWFLMFSDGLLEQENEVGQTFDMTLLRKSLSEGPACSMKSIEKMLKTFGGNAASKDDISFCAVEPSSILPEMQTTFAVCQNRNVLRSLQGEDFFEWSTVIAGPRIGHTHVPILCNEVLSKTGISQELSQRVFTILTELYVNAVDHGLLELPSDLKEGPDGFFAYMEEREARMGLLTGRDRVDVRICWDPDQVPPTFAISVADTGKGFSGKLGVNSKEPYQVHGRGLSLVKSLVSRLEIRPPGNHVIAVLELSPSI